MLGDAEKLTDHHCRKGIGEASDDVGLPVSRDLIEKRVRQHADARLHRGYAFWR